MAHAAASGFDFTAASLYAGTWWDRYNPAYTRFGNDCQNYVSQILHAGGVAEDVFGTWVPNGAPWVNTSWFNNWASNFGPFKIITDWPDVNKGDVLQVNWTGGSTPQHVVWVDDIFDSRVPLPNIPLVTSHTNARWNYPLTNIWSRYPRSAWWVFEPVGATRGGGGGTPS